jgi:uncharacterized protein YcfJ
LTSTWKLVAASICALSISTAAAYAQELSVGDLKAKGAKVLSADEVKSLLVGANQSYENVQFVTQMTVNPDGSLNGSGRRRVGGGQTGMFRGKWNITDTGRFCAEHENFGAYGGGGKYCRDIYNLGDKYYYAQGNPGNDERAAVEMRISK